MGTASWLVWQKGGDQRQKSETALMCEIRFCCSEEAIVSLCSPVSSQLPVEPDLLRSSHAEARFDRHCLSDDLSDPKNVRWLYVLVLDVVLAATIATFFKQSKTAGSLLLPYMAWSLYATALNAKIISDNPSVHSLSHSFHAHAFSPAERKEEGHRWRKLSEARRRTEESLKRCFCRRRCCRWSISKQTNDCP